MQHPEHKLQCLVVKYLRTVHPGVLFCASIAGHVKMTMRQWIRANDAGYQAGFPDLVLYEPRGEYHGFALELKSEKGRTSAEQMGVLAILAANKYRVDVANSFDSAVRAINAYMTIKNKGE